ncbi:MAG: sulfatase-like hydrolase/transferase [Planctomycetota bacterium]
MSLAALACLAVLAQEPASNAPRPNLVLVLADDLDPHHLGFLGNALARTPHLDQLAREGVLLRTAWAQPVCRPALATLLTGRWPHESGILSNLQPKRLLDPANTLPQLLKQAGYATYCAGKWWEGELASFGFDAPAEPDPRFAREGDGKQDLERFLAEHGAQPWFVWWAPSLPHTPHRAPARFVKEFAEVEIPVPADFEGSAEAYVAAERASLAMHAWLDAELKHFLNGLAESGELADTRLVFVGDNGWATALNSKGTPREQGLRSPVVLWSGAGGVTPVASDELVDLVDVTATLLDWAGVAPPAGARGHSLAPLLVGQPWHGRARLFGEIYTRDGGLFALCARDARWKYVEYVATVKAYELSPGPRLAPEFRRRAGALELFDLAADPTEQRNLAKQPEHAERLAEWRTATRAWWTETGGGALPEPEER